MSQELKALNTLFPQPNALTGGSPLGIENSLFAQARKRARRGQFWSRLTGRPRALYALKQVRVSCTIRERNDGGTRPVPINRIRGSESRSRYFDSDFNPLFEQARGRWLSIARARQRGMDLPPVLLIQVGDVYFVKDGHHRISVARALGQRSIDAKVTVWRVSGLLPWESEMDVPRLGFKNWLTGITHILKARQREGATA